MSKLYEAENLRSSTNNAGEALNKYYSGARYAQPLCNAYQNAFRYPQPEGWNQSPVASYDKPMYPIEDYNYSRMKVPQNRPKTTYPENVCNLSSRKYWSEKMARYNQLPLDKNDNASSCVVPIISTVTTVCSVSSGNNVQGWKQPYSDEMDRYNAVGKSKLLHAMSNHYRRINSHKAPPPPSYSGEESVQKLYSNVLNHKSNLEKSHYNEDDSLIESIEEEDVLYDVGSPNETTTETGECRPPIPESKNKENFRQYYVYPVLYNQPHQYPSSGCCGRNYGNGPAPVQKPQNFDDCIVQKRHCEPQQSQQSLRYLNYTRNEQNYDGYTDYYQHYKTPQKPKPPGSKTRFYSSEQTYREDPGRNQYYEKTNCNQYIEKSERNVAPQKDRCPNLEGSGRSAEIVPSHQTCCGAECDCRRAATEKVMPDYKPTLRLPQPSSQETCSFKGFYKSTEIEKTSSKQKLSVSCKKPPRRKACPRLASSSQIPLTSSKLPPKSLGYKCKPLPGVCSPARPTLVSIIADQLRLNPVIRDTRSLSKIPFKTCKKTCPTKSRCALKKPEKKRKCKCKRKRDGEESSSYLENCKKMVSHALSEIRSKMFPSSQCTTPCASLPTQQKLGCKQCVAKSPNSSPEASGKISASNVAAFDCQCVLRYVLRKIKELEGNLNNQKKDIEKQKSLAAKTGRQPKECKCKGSDVHTSLKVTSSQVSTDMEDGKKHVSEVCFIKEDKKCRKCNNAPRMKKRSESPTRTCSRCSTKKSVNSRYESEVSSSRCSVGSISKSPSKTVSSKDPRCACSGKKSPEAVGKASTSNTVGNSSWSKPAGYCSEGDDNIGSSETNPSCCRCGSDAEG